MTYWTTTGSENLRGDTFIRQVVGAQPREIGRYRVLEAIGEGGMGTVYKCVGSALGEQDLVAVKLFKKTVSDTESATREALVLSQLDHPNVARFRDFGLFDGRPFVVMRLYPAGNLSTWLAQRKRPWSEMLAILEGIARGLHYMHQQGVLHLDVKPHNILFDHDGLPRLADFGISTLIRDAQTAPDSSDSQHNTTRYYTRRYASPEQLRGDQLSPHSDQYSFCRMIQVDIVDNTIGRVPRRVQQMLARGLTESPGERYESMLQLVQALTGNRKRRLRNIVLVSMASLLLGGGAVSAAPSLGNLLHPCQAVSLSANHWAQHRQAVLQQLGPEATRVETFVGSAVERSTQAREELCESSAFDDRESPRYHYVDNCLAIHDETVRIAIDLLPTAAPKYLPKILETLEELTEEPEACLRAKVEGSTAMPKIAHPSLKAPIVQLLRAQILDDFGDHQASRNEAKAALDSLGSDSRTELLRAQAHLQLGQTFAAEASYPQAMLHLRQAETIAVKTRHYPLLLDVLNKVLDVSRDDRSVSKTAGLKAIGRAEQIAKLVDDPKRFATFLNLRGGMHYLCGEPELALADFEKALRVLDSEGARAVVLRLQIQSNLAAIYSGQGKAEEAAAIFAENMARSEEVFGTRHPQVTTYRHNYANALSDLGQHNQALDNFLQVIEYEEQTNQSPLRTLTYTYPDALSSALAAGSLEMADILADQLAGILAQVDGDNRAATAVSLAEYMTAIGRVDEALNFLCTAAETSGLDNESHTKLALADALLIAGDRHQATSIYRQVVEYTTSDDSRNYAQVGLLMVNLIDRPETATITRVEQLAESLDSSQHIWAARAFDVAAEASRVLGDSDQAERLLVRAHQTFPHVDILATPSSLEQVVALPCTSLDTSSQRSNRNGHPSD